MKYDFSQEDANEVLEKADANNDALTQKNAALKARLEQLEAIADELHNQLCNSLIYKDHVWPGSFDGNVARAREAYKAYKSQVDS